MSKHTEGPWKIERVPIQSQGGSNTCFKIGPFNACIYDDWRPRHAGISEASNEANARLIASAPCLLEACKAMYSLLYHGSDNANPEVGEAIHKAYYAIARATGETP